MSQLFDQSPLWFLVGTILISLTGAMAPGPLTAATLTAGVRRRHAGVRMALGHGVVEVALVAAILAGIGGVLQLPSFRVAMGLAGGATLIVMAGMTLLASDAESGNSTQSTPVPRYGRMNPFWAGALLSGTNPYLFLWWATAGLLLLTTAATFGPLMVALCYATHWLCDLVWMEILSQASFRGAAVLQSRGQRMLLNMCGVAMGGFGLYFLAQAIRTLTS